MTTYYKLGVFAIFRTHDEALRLARERCRTPDYLLWQAEGDADKLRELEVAEQARRDAAGAEITPLEIDAVPVYQGSSGTWSVWSDGLVRDLCLRTLRVYDPDSRTRPFLTDYIDDTRNSGFDREAAQFIASWRGADSAMEAWAGRIRQVTAKKEVLCGPPHGHYAGKRVVRYDLRLTLPDEARRVFVFTVGYFEGYAFEVYNTMGEAVKAAEPPPCPLTECMECGAVFDTPGHVEWGGMSCDRCNL